MALASLIAGDACIKLVSIHTLRETAVTGFRYNHGLLLDEVDQAAAADAYPAIFPALDHEQLRRRFARIDAEANRMKAISRRAFAQHKLRETGAWLSKQPADQLRAVKWAGGGAILLSVLLHLIVAAGVLSAWSDWPLTWIHIAAIWLAILALAVRTLDEGLRPGREIERYRAYRDGARNILDRFDTAPTLADALQAMREMEELSYDEMVTFLKSNKEASFAM